MHTVATVNVFGRPMEIASVTEYGRDAYAREVYVEVVVKGHNGGLLHGVVCDPAAINIETQLDDEERVALAQYGTDSRF